MSYTKRKITRETVQIALGKTIMVTVLFTAITSLIPLCTHLTSGFFSEYSSIAELVKNFAGALVVSTGVMLGIAACLSMLYETLVEEKEE